MPTLDEFTRWMQGYQDAMTTLDAEAAGELFSDDAKYYESPSAAAVRGRTAIVEYWRMVGQVMRDVEFGFEVLATTEAVGVARVNDALTRIPSDRRVRYDGIFFARFDAAMQCEEFREWWEELRPTSEPTPD